MYNTIVNPVCVELFSTMATIAPNGHSSKIDTRRT